MTTITTLNRTTPASTNPVTAGVATSTASTATATSNSASTLVSLTSSATESAAPAKALVWESRNRSTAATMMAQNINEQPLAGRLKGLGGELLKQVAYDGADFSQTVQQIASGVQTDTYDTLVSPTQLTQHGMGDNQFALTITTRSGVKVELSLDASDSSIAVEAKSDGTLTEAERKALGELSTAFQKTIDGLTQDPPRIDLAGLTQFDHSALSSVDLKAQVKLLSNDTQSLQFHADSTKRTLSFNGPAGSANIGVDLSQPASWGSKEQQAKALGKYLQQVDQAGGRGQGDAIMIGMFKDAFTDMNSDYGTPATTTAARGIALTAQDRAFTTGLADFTASFTQTEVASNPARASEKDSFEYQVSQKTSISGTSQLDRGVSQLQESHLKARYHSPVSADATLALTESPQSQNYKYNIIDDTASSKTDIGYDQGVLAKASLEMQASQSTRVMKYVMDKLTDDRTTPTGKSWTRDLLTTLEPERIGRALLSDDERQHVLSNLNDYIFLQSNPDAIQND